MGLLHKLIAYPEIGTAALSTFFFPIKLLHQSVLSTPQHGSLRQLFADNVLQTMHKEREGAKVVKGLLCFLVVETNPINTWHLPHTANTVIP